MLRWSSQEELSRHLHRTRELPGWDAEGSYIPWLFQNALLLPGYLNQEPVPETEEFPLDSWAAFVAAIESVGIASSSLIVPLTEDVPSVALVGAASAATKVSLASLSVSAMVATVVVTIVCPAGIVRTKPVTDV